MPLSTASKIKVVSFDIAGTLIAPYPSVGVAYQTLLKELGIEASAEVLEQRFFSAYGEAVQVSRTHLSEGSEREFWLSIVEQVLEEIEIEPFSTEQVFNHLFNGFGDKRFWVLLPGIAELLKSLSEAGYSIVAISNADSRFRSVLKDLGALPYFEKLFLSSELGLEKPDPKMFTQVMQLFPDLPAESFLHVGDSRAHDIEGAEAVGWQSVQVDGTLNCIKDLYQALIGRSLPES